MKHAPVHYSAIQSRGRCNRFHFRISHFRTYHDTVSWLL